MADVIIIHTDEISLKGRNRAVFERMLAADIMRKLPDPSRFRTATRKGTVLLRHDGPMTAVEEAAAREALGTVFGIANLMFAETTEKDMDAICAAARQAMADRTGTRFRVTTRRSDKSFPLRSMDVSRDVGAAVLRAVPRTSVDLHDPEVTVRVDILERHAYVAVGRTAGAGGLPVGSTGKVAVLLSGGIDSPVAAWKLMRRGATAELVHFHSYPYVGRESIDKVRRLASALSRWQGPATLHLVPFGDLQREITAETNERMRVVLYRRFMLRIAERIARDAGARALVTGESLGQVASQTLENMVAVDAAASMPVLRPLVGEDKRDIVDLAKRVGTYDISIEPHDDCCTLFVPSSPELRATPASAAREESRLDVDTLVADALARTEVEEVTARAGNAKVVSQ